MLIALSAVLTCTISFIFASFVTCHIGMMPMQIRITPKPAIKVSRRKTFSCQISISPVPLSHTKHSSLPWGIVPSSCHFNSPRSCRKRPWRRQFCRRRLTWRSLVTARCHSAVRATAGTCRHLLPCRPDPTFAIKTLHCHHTTLSPPIAEAFVLLASCPPTGQHVSRHHFQIPVVA